jgi:lysophospholipid hydrolase
MTPVRRDPKTKPVLSKDKRCQQPSPCAQTLQTPTSRHEVQAGDLHSTAAHSEVYRSHDRSFSILNTPRGGTASPSIKEDAWDGMATRISGMISIFETKLCPALPNRSACCSRHSVEVTLWRHHPHFLQLMVAAHRVGHINSSFGSLSLLDLRDDSSSLTGGSSSVTAGGYMSGLDNEIEILFLQLVRPLQKLEKGTQVTFLNVLNGSLFTLHVRAILRHRRVPGHLTSR